MSKRKTVNIYNLKHDINNILFKLETSLQLLKEENKSQEEILNICESSIKNIKTLFELLILLDRIEKGSVPFQEAKSVINSILKHLPKANLEIKKQTAVLTSKNLLSSIEKFYVDSIILILDVFDIDTEVKFIE